MEKVKHIPKNLINRLRDLCSAGCATFDEQQNILIVLDEKQLKAIDKKFNRDPKNSIFKQLKRHGFRRIQNEGGIIFKVPSPKLEDLASRHQENCQAIQTEIGRISGFVDDLQYGKDRINQIFLGLAQSKHSQENLKNLNSTLGDLKISLVNCTEQGRQAILNVIQLQDKQKKLYKDLIERLSGNNEQMSG